MGIGPAVGRSSVADHALQLRTPFVELVPGVRSAVGQAGRFPCRLVVVEQRCRARVGQRVVPAVEFVVGQQRVDVIRGVHPGLAEQVIQWGDDAGQREMEPPNIVQHNDIGHVGADQRGVELLRHFVVVLARVDQLDRQPGELALEAGDQLLFDGGGLARVIGPERNGTRAGLHRDAAAHPRTTGRHGRTRQRQKRPAAQRVDGAHVNP